MRMQDLITKKRNGECLTSKELSFWVNGYVKGEIPDYQVSALLMAIYFQGMSDEELGELTILMARSGDMADLSSIHGYKVDKHSTGGVGDKTTLIIAPIVAANGVKVAKMSGRGLGFTGGTIDKLESIPGFCTTLNQKTFFENVNRHGVSVVGQSGNLVPADKKLYALRDVTGTVESIPLIASSIMSKKLASGSDAILLDVKVGSGAFMKTPKEAVTLAKKMIAIGKHSGRKVSAMITNMDEPLGKTIGNTLEVVEAIETLKGKGPVDLTELCVDLAAEMMWLGQKGTRETCRELAEDALYSGKALEKFKEMVEAQGGDGNLVDHPQYFEKAPVIKQVRASQNGYIAHMDAQKCGIAASILGAGRKKKEDAIDYTAGIRLEAKCGDFVREGEVLASLYTSNPCCVEEAEKNF